MISLPAVHGRVYFPSCSPTTLVAAPDTFYAFPFVPPRAQGFDQIGLRVTSGGTAGAEMRLAIYLDRNGRPGSLLSQFGPVAVTAEGAAEITVSPPFSLVSRGTLWLAAVFSEADTMPTVSAVGAAPRIGAGIGAASFGELPSDEGDLAAGVRGAMGYGAFPEVAPEAEPVASDGVPLIGLRAV